MKKFNFLLIASLFVAQASFAGVIADDNLDLGKPTSTATKSLTFKGPVKKKISSTQAGAMSYDGNSLLLGDGANTVNKMLQFNKGASSPYLQYNFSTGGLESGNATSVSHSANALTFGDGTNSNKVLKFNKGASSPEIRYNSTTSKLEFSNDASLYKAIGSGGGSGGDGGVNLLVNPGFEDGATIDWTSSGGTYSQQTYSNGTETNTKFVRFVASTSGQYFESSAKVIPDALGVGCMADIKYNQAGANFTMSVIDGSAVTLASQTLTTVTAWTKAGTLAFPCPAAAGTMKVRFTSTAAGTLDADDGYLGGNKNISAVSQARLFAEVSYASSTASATTSSTYVDSAAGSQGASYSNSSAPTSTRYGLTLPYMPAGRYMIVATGFSANAGSTTTNSASYGSFAATDIATATTCGYIAVQGNLNGQTDTSNGADFTCNYTVTTPLSNKEFWIKQKALTGNVNIANGAGSKISVYYFPTSSELALTPDQSKWLIDANIGGGNANITSINSTYTEIATASTLDMVINTSKGSANAEIACASGNASTGLTCAAGNESVGIAFTPPYAGLFEVCLAYEVSSGAGHAGAHQLIETPNNSTTILQEGGERQQLLGASSQTDFPLRTCGTFTFNDTSKRTIRLMYESQDATSWAIIMDRSSGLGQRDAKFTVKPLLYNVARPVLVSKSVTSSVLNKRVVDFKIEGSTPHTNCTSSPCGVRQDGADVTSVIRGSTGDYSITFAAGVFNREPTCSFTSKAVAVNNAIPIQSDGIGTATSKSFITILGNTGAAIDAYTEAVCYGTY